MGVEIIDFEVARARSTGLLVVTMKQITDERGTIRELFRRSAFEAAGVDIASFQQINITESGARRSPGPPRRGDDQARHRQRRRGARRLPRPATGSATFGRVATVRTRAGTQVLVPSGVANGFQALADGTPVRVLLRPGVGAGHVRVGVQPARPGSRHRRGRSPSTSTTRPRSRPRIATLPTLPVFASLRQERSS
jgi:hypothetical protein